MQDIRDWDAVGMTGWLEELVRDGVALRRGAFDCAVLEEFRLAAERLFACGDELPREFGYDRNTQGARLRALVEFGVADVMAPVREIAECIGGTCGLEDSWVRRRFSPGGGPAGHRPNAWHQDGGLRVQFPVDVLAPMPAMTPLVTCWIPLQACGVERPGLEVVRRPVAELLHYTLLPDEALRQRFRAEDFWAPELASGDGLVFLRGTLHRTHVLPEMTADRTSIEYRFFLDA